MTFFRMLSSSEIYCLRRAIGVEQLLDTFRQITEALFADEMGDRN